MSQLRIDNPFAPNKLEDLSRRWAEPLNLGEASSPQINIEVKETDKDFLVKAQIPGVKKEDVGVRIDGDTVSIRAELREEKEGKYNGKALHSGIRYGAASRSFSLGTGVGRTLRARHFRAGAAPKSIQRKPQIAYLASSFLRTLDCARRCRLSKVYSAFISHFFWRSLNETHLDRDCQCLSRALFCAPRQALQHRAARRI